MCEITRNDVQIMVTPYAYLTSLEYVSLRELSNIRVLPQHGAPHIPPEHRANTERLVLARLLGSRFQHDHELFFGSH
jgi:hypothetical protein